MSAKGVLLVLDIAADRAIEERDQHDANNAPEYADAWESLRADLREAHADVKELINVCNEMESRERGYSADPSRVLLPRFRAAIAACKGDSA
jgi:hypothetical protein